MKCPSCKDVELNPRELEHGLIAAGCEKCEGALLSLMNYRYWQHTYGKAEPKPEDLNAACVKETTIAKLCPKCKKLMTKYRIDLDTENRVELCSSCDEVWLDSGEWQLLKTLDLQGELPKLFTEAWQRELRKRREHRRWDKHFSDIIGREEFEKVKAFKQWLDRQAHAADIKHYLLTKFD